MPSLLPDDIFQSPVHVTPVQDNDFDPVVQDINNGFINQDNISFNYLHRNYRVQNGVTVWQSLNRGKAVLSSVRQLDQYLHSYGPMVRQQWSYALDQVDIDAATDKVQFIDYGCGQGLASMLFMDHFLHARKHISQITLIDASAPALRRAQALLQCYNSQIKITPVNKTLNQVSCTDLPYQSSLSKIHLLSNIVDIDNFNVYKLADSILSCKGDNFVVIVGNDRDVFGGTQRMVDLYQSLTKNAAKQIKKPVFKRFSTTKSTGDLIQHVYMLIQFSNPTVDDALLDFDIF